MSVYAVIDFETAGLSPEHDVRPTKLPRRALVLVLEWAVEHRTELIEDWHLCRTKPLPKPIKPLKSFPQRHGVCVR